MTPFEAGLWKWVGVALGLALFYWWRHRKDKP